MIVPRLVAALALSVVAGCQAPTVATDATSAPTATDPSGMVARVVDGDTVLVTTGGRPITVRILGIDSPETKDPRKPVQCWGPEASEFARATLLDQRVQLVADPSQDARDRYGRTLAYVRLADGRDYSVEAARAGVARAYTYKRPVAEHDQIAAAEADAKAAGRGLWGSCPV